MYIEHSNLLVLNYIILWYAPQQLWKRKNSSLFLDRHTDTAEDINSNWVTIIMCSKMFLGHVLLVYRTLKRCFCIFVHVRIKIRFIPLRSNISLPRQLEYVCSKTSQQARNFITSKEQKYRERNGGDGERAARRGGRRRCLSPKTSISKHWQFLVDSAFMASQVFQAQCFMQSRGSRNHDLFIYFLPGSVQAFRTICRN